MNIKEICTYFDIKGDILNILENNNGLINKSYIVYTDKQNYIIQKINTIVFKNPKLLMDNIEKVITHLNYKYKCTCENLILTPTKLGNNCLKINGDFYRCYHYLDNSITYNSVENNMQLFEMGKVLGEFQKNLNDFDVDSLYVTINDFHSTDIRYLNLIEAYKSACLEKQIEVLSMLYYIVENEKEYNKIISRLEKKEIPRRVVHNDTKLNNVIFNKFTKKASCLIDLDTVMPGSLLFDFGDAVRSSSSTQEEDSKKIEDIDIDMNRYLYFLIGYLSMMKDTITQKEVELLVDSIYIITMEITMRFLTDYLNGNKYFMVSYEKHNLDRAKNQIKLAKQIQNKKEFLENVLKSVIKHLSIA